MDNPDPKPSLSINFHFGSALVLVFGAAVLGCLTPLTDVQVAFGDGGPDAGVDSGSDAGLDGGVDAGIDAGPSDAGADAGLDAGPDAGQDAGGDGGSDGGDAGSVDAGDGGPCDTGCVIFDAGEFCEGQLDPSNLCQGCFSDASTMAWTFLPYQTPCAAGISGLDLNPERGQCIQGFDPDTSAWYASCQCYYDGENCTADYQCCTGHCSDGGYCLTDVGGYCVAPSFGVDECTSQLCCPLPGGTIRFRPTGQGTIFFQGYCAPFDAGDCGQDGGND